MEAEVDDGTGNIIPAPMSACPLCRTNAFGEIGIVIEGIIPA